MIYCIKRVRGDGGGDRMCVCCEEDTITRVVIEDEV